MPTLRRIGCIAVCFYSNEGAEPPHIHAQRGDALAKFWLVPVSLAASSGWKAHELRRVARLVSDHQQEFLEAWREFFDA